VAHRLDGRVRDGGEDRGEQVDGRHLAVAEQHTGRVDVPLRVGLVAGRVGLGEPLGVAADVQPAGLVEEHTGRQQRLTVEQQRSGAPVWPTQHGNRVGRAQIDPERVPLHLPTSAGRGDARPCMVRAGHPR